MDSGFVYIIHSKTTTHYKIGMSVDVANRLCSLQGANANQLQLLHKYECSDRKLAEKTIHKHFMTNRIKGEWFNFSDTEITSVCDFMDTTITNINANCLSKPPVCDKKNKTVKCKQVKYKHSCHYCGFETDHKSTFDRHNLSMRHLAKSNKTVQKEIKKQEQPKKPTKYECDCGQEFKYRQGLSKHKLHRCKAPTQPEPTNTGPTNQQFQTLIDLLKTIVGPVNNGKIGNNNTNVSVFNSIKIKYPDAPPLKKLRSYSSLTGDEDFVNILIYHYRKSLLHRYLGDFLIGEYKKTDPSKQSLWASDTSRLKYITLTILNQNHVWIEDDGGCYMIDRIINPMLCAIRPCLDANFLYLAECLQKLGTERSSVSVDRKMHNIQQDMIATNAVRSAIDDKVLAVSIAQYIIPSFKFIRDGSIKKHDLKAIEMAD